MEFFFQVRGVSSCSKDTLIFIDQQGHRGNLMDEETNFMANQPLWVRIFMKKNLLSIESNFNENDFLQNFQISPVTPHKLITVSPKN